MDLVPTIIGCLKPPSPAQVSSHNIYSIRYGQHYIPTCDIILMILRIVTHAVLCCVVSPKVEITVRCQPRSAALPAAHTCFFQLDVPDYDKEAVLRHKLLQAVNNTSSFDVV